MIIGSGIWWLLSTSERSLKLKILSKFSDEIFRFLLIAFVSNVLFHLSDVLQAPYQALLLTKEPIFLAVVITVTYNLWELLPKIVGKPALLVSVLQFIFLQFSLNHLFYYSLYNSSKLHALASLNIILLITITFIKLQNWQQMGLILGSAIGNLVLMNGSRVLYFGFVFTPELLVTTTFLFIIIIFVRRKQLSKQT